MRTSSLKLAGMLGAGPGRSSLRREEMRSTEAVPEQGTAVPASKQTPEVRQKSASATPQETSRSPMAGSGTPALRHVPFASIMLGFSCCRKRPWIPGGTGWASISTVRTGTPVGSSSRSRWPATPCSWIGTSCPEITTQFVAVPLASVVRWHSVSASMISVARGLVGGMDGEDPPSPGSPRLGVSSIPWITSSQAGL